MSTNSSGQYPHVRAMRTCLACGGPKHVGLIVCWQCHNALKMRYDHGYGPTMERILQVAEVKREQVVKSR